MNIIDKIAKENALLMASSDEAVAKDAFRTWLPTRFAWLMGHPRLLRLYLRLPHRTRPVMLTYTDGRREMVFR